MNFSIESFGFEMPPPHTESSYRLNKKRSFRRVPISNITGLNSDEDQVLNLDDEDNGNSEEEDIDEEYEDYEDEDLDEEDAVGDAEEYGDDGTIGFDFRLVNTVSEYKGY